MLGTVERRDHVSIYRWHGPFDKAAAQQLTIACWSDDQFDSPYVLLDFRAGQNKLSLRDVQEAVQFEQRFMHRRHYGRIAFLVRPEHVALVEWYAHAMQEAPFDIQPYTDEAAALAWLESVLG